MSTQSRNEAQKRRITLDRRYPGAGLEDVWELWTTAEGIESWWGPEGFSVKVQKIELRPGGEMVYAMTADAPEQVAFMKRSGMPLTTVARITYQQISPQTRFTYTGLVDFVPGVAPYEVNHLVQLRDTGKAIELSLSFDAMHDDTWTQRMAMGWEGQLLKLDKVLAS